MKQNINKQAVSLSGRIGILFLVASSLLVFLAYLVVSQNIKSLLTDYTKILVENMVDQGVTTVEYELESGKNEANVVAQSLAITNDIDIAKIPKSYRDSDLIRMIYVHDGKNTSTNGKKYEIQSRKDIVDGYEGKTTVYGPYFNEKDEFIICYTAPVYKNNTIIGVVTIEKDAYKLSEIIKEIRFINTGESYIINAEGTDIAVSDMEHVDWVTDEYNAHILSENEHTEETRSIMELEKKGLRGEKGTGSYIWNSGEVYVTYAPIPSVGWVLLGGLRQEEINAITKSVLFDSLTKGPILSITVIIFIILALLILYWIITSLRKSAEINEKFKIMAKYDALTGILNRNSYHERIDKLTEDEGLMTCIYIDVNGLHEINNHLGHQAGDTMLKDIAASILDSFSDKDVFRIGGDEFVVLCKDLGSQEVKNRIQHIRSKLIKKGYEISIGIASANCDSNINNIINQAEERMYADKREFYRSNGDERQIRDLDSKLERLLTEKKDADTFLTLLAPEFKGVYFVDMSKDTIRHLNIPSYFEEILKETNEVFSEALKIYNERMIRKEYQKRFTCFCDFKKIEERMENNINPELTYQKNDGSWMKVRVLKFKTYTKASQETLWFFTSVDGGI